LEAKFLLSAVFLTHFSLLLFPLYKKFKFNFSVPTRSVSIAATIVIQLQTNPRAPLIPPPRERMRRRRLSVMRQRKMELGKERRRSHQLLIRRPLLLLLIN